MILLLLLLGGGCANRPPNPQTDDVLFFVPGVAGDGGSYDGLVRGLREAGMNEHLEVLGWGAPGPLFLLNFQNDAIHRGAEAKLAAAMKAWREAHPSGRIDLIAHSAGCGVALGALALPGTPSIRTAVLLNPSVSPGYDLSGALANVSERLHVFYSDRDTVFLSWRTSTFGTYDNVKTKAAGHLGFDLANLPMELRRKVTQHPRDETWTEQGNDGSHFGTTSQAFVKQSVGPLLR